MRYDDDLARRADCAPAAVTATAALAQVRSIRSLRPALAANGLQDDRNKCDSAANMAPLADTGANRLMVPAEYGGLWEGWPFAGWGRAHPRRDGDRGRRRADLPELGDDGPGEPADFRSR